MNLLTSLRDRTRPYHESLERQFGLFDRSWSVSQYRALLRRFFGYYEPLEGQLETAADWSRMGIDWPRRRKSPLLELDLLSIGDSSAVMAALPRCHDLPMVSGLPQALGCMYVLEGATLGGRVVAHHLSKVPGLSGGAWFSFFLSYGEEVGPRWQAFREFLTAQAGGGDEAIVEAACQTFKTMEQWLRE